MNNKMIAVSFVTGFLFQCCLWSKRLTNRARVQAPVGVGGLLRWSRCGRVVVCGVAERFVPKNILPDTANRSEWSVLALQ